MTIADQILKSLSGTLRAFHLIKKSKLSWVYVFPIAVYALIYITGFSITNQLHTEIMLYFKSLTSEWVENNYFFSFLFTASSVLTWIILKLSIFILLGIISGYATLILLSPLYTYISERIEEEITGVSYPFNISKFVRDVLRAVVIAIRNGLIQIGWTIILFILSFIPIVNLFTVPALFIITAYFYGFSFLDYSHEKLGLTLGQSNKEVRNMKYAAISLGAIFLLCYMVPWVGPFIASLMSFQLIVSATSLIIENNLNKSREIKFSD